MENYFELTDNQIEILKEDLGVKSLDNVSITFQVESDKTIKLDKNKSREEKFILRRKCRCKTGVHAGKWKSTCCPH